MGLDVITKYSAAGDLMWQVAEGEDVYDVYDVAVSCSGLVYTAKYNKDNIRTHTADGHKKEKIRYPHPRSVCVASGGQLLVGSGSPGSGPWYVSVMRADGGGRRRLGELPGVPYRLALCGDRHLAVAVNDHIYLYDISGLLN